jgi:hypothetical protein
VIAIRNTKYGFQSQKFSSLKLWTEYEMTNYLIRLQTLTNTLLEGHRKVFETLRHRRQTHNSIPPYLHNVNCQVGVISLKGEALCPRARTGKLLLPRKHFGCLNLHEQMSQMSAPMSFPLPVTTGERRFSCKQLYDVSLALSMRRKVVGNDVSADNKQLVIITGANQGGKSTFCAARVWLS